jgi:hypothetical protein
MCGLSPAKKYDVSNLCAHALCKFCKLFRREKLGDNGFQPVFLMLHPRKAFCAEVLANPGRQVINVFSRKRSPARNCNGLYAAACLDSFLEYLEGAFHCNVCNVN